MGKKRKTESLFRFFACLIFTFLLLCGCEKKQEKTIIVEQTGGGMIDLYYPDENQVKKSELAYQIKQPDSVSASVEEVMAALMVYFQEDMNYHTYMIDAENNVSLELELLSEKDDVYVLLADASIAKTLFQIQEIQNVEILLVDENENQVKDSVYSRDSFYFYDYDDVNLNSKQVRIFYGTPDGLALTSGIYLISTEPNVTIEEKIVITLAQKNYIPKDSMLNFISMSGGICYMDFNRDFMDDHIYTSGAIPLYALVNSITSLEGIDAVQITIEGEKITNYRDGWDISMPLSFDDTLVEKN